MKKKDKKKLTGGERRPIELRGSRPRGHVILSQKDIANGRSENKRKIAEAMEE